MKRSPADIIGLTNPGVFQLGDSVCGGPPARFQGFPRFACEHFAVLRNRRSEKYKQFQKGIQQLSEEGVVQLFFERNASRTEPTLGVVGAASVRGDPVSDAERVRRRDHIGPAPLTVSCAGSKEARRPSPTFTGRAARGKSKMIAGGWRACSKAKWVLNYFTGKYPDLTFSETATDG